MYIIAFLSSIVSRERGGSLRPPLPTIVRQSLSRRRLAYLGTVDITATTASNGGSVPCPHLSLMRFTYLPEEDAILMSTNVYTKKYDMLSTTGGGATGREEQSTSGALVALLVHDFADSSHSSSSIGKEMVNEGGGMYSITLNGTCSVVKDGTIFLFFSCVGCVGFLLMHAHHVVICATGTAMFLCTFFPYTLSLSLSFFYITTIIIVVVIVSDVG